MSEDMRQMAKAKEAKATVPDVAALSAVFGAQPQAPKVDVAEAETLFERKMASKSSGNYKLTFGLVSMQVKSYKATDNDTVSFNTIHTKCNHKLQMINKMHCPVCECDVDGSPLNPGPEMTKGYEKAKGEFIAVSPEEIKACRPASEELMAIDEFVKATQIDPTYFESTYFLAPDKGCERAFGLLVMGLRETGRIAIARVVYRGRECRVALRPFGDCGMTMHFLFFGYEVRDCEKWAKVPTQFTEQEVKVAKQLIEAFADDFDPDATYDSYLVNVKKMLAAKVAGAETPKVEEEVAAPVTKADDLMAVLMQSIENAPSHKAKVSSKKAKAKSATRRKLAVA